MIHDFETNCSQDNFSSSVEHCKDTKVLANSNPGYGDGKTYLKIRLFLNESLQLF